MAQRQVFSRDAIVTWLCDGGGAAATLTWPNGDRESLPWISYDADLADPDKRIAYWQEALEPHVPVGTVAVQAYLRRSESGKWDTRDRRAHGAQELTVSWREATDPAPGAMERAPYRAPEVPAFTPPPGLAFAPPADAEMMGFMSPHHDLVPQLFNYLMYMQDRREKEHAAHLARLQESNERLTVAVIQGSFLVARGEQSKFNMEEMFNFLGSRAPNLQIGARSIAKDPAAPAPLRQIAEAGDYVFGMISELFPNLSEEERKAKTVEWLAQQEAAARQALGGGGS